MSFLNILLLSFVSCVRSGAIPVNDSPESDFEYKILERLIKTDLTLADLQRKVKHLTDLHSQGITLGLHGFSVASTNEMDNLRVHQVLVFDDVIYNPDNGYNKMTGIFTVLVQGTYLILGSIFSPPQKHIQTEIIAGNQIVARLYAASSDSWWDQGSNSVVVDLLAGDQVFMRVDEWGGETLWGNRWSTFSAICLKHS